MSTDRWHDVKALLDEALALPPEQRTAYLEQRCDEKSVREEVLSLLSFYEEAPDFLEEPVREEAYQAIVAQQEHASIGKRVGPYRLEREIGQGGMGTVFLAERADGAYTKQVAVKLVRQGGTREDLLRRLRHERQILALLKHPNIARLLDGGVTDDGQPYLVMEYVEGYPIDHYCDTQRLSTEERLRLMLVVCEAVQFAHRNLVVHRDLKPSNIFVANPLSEQTPGSSPGQVPGTGPQQAQVKLLDFGIAKLLIEDPQAMPPMTQTGMRVMTPEYASPEQVRGAPVTTASDVYALGVILYELLTGRRPYDVRNQSPTQVERLICEQEPPLPSTAILRDAVPAEASPETKPEAVGYARNTPPEKLRRQLRGDLDNIVMKALRKEPERRYGSVAELGEDIRRHLSQLPVEARPDTVGYRVSKFVRRHRVGVAATVMVMVALLAGIFFATNQARVAAAERDRAERRFNDVRALANTLLFDLHDAIRDLPGATPAREMVVGQALKYLNLLVPEADEDPGLQRELAEAYLQVGEIQGDPHFPNLGDLSGTTESYRKALALHQEQWQRDSSDTAVRRALANSYGRLAVVLSWGGDNEQAITLSQQALALLAPLAQETPTDAGVQHDLGRIRSELGWWLIWAGRVQEGMDYLAQAEGPLEVLARLHPNDLDLQIDLWRVYAYQDDGLQFEARYDEALDLIDQKAYPHLMTLEERFPRNPRVRSSLRTYFNKRGGASEKLGRLAEALGAYQSSLRIAEAQVLADSTNKLGYRGMAAAKESIGAVFLEMEQTEAAFKVYQEALAIRQGLYEQDPEHGELGNTLGIAHRALCKLYLETRVLEEGLAQCKEGVAVLEKAVAADPQNAVGRENLATAYAYTAQVYGAMAQQAGQAARQTHRDAALEWYDKSLDIFRALQAEGISWAWTIHPDTLAAERAVLAALLP